MINQSLKIFLGLAIALATGISQAAFAAQESEQGPYVIMLGAPGAGKSTQSKTLAEQHKIAWITIDHIAAEAVAKIDAENKAQAKSKKKHGPSKIRRTYSSQRAVKTESALKKLQSGELVDDDSLNMLVATELLDSEAEHGFVLDGFPMTIQQASFVDSLLEAKGLGPVDVIYVNVPDSVALERMEARGRADDVKGLGEERLKQFRANIQLVLDYYGDDVSEIDGSQSKTAVAKAIEAALND